MLLFSSVQHDVRLTALNFAPPDGRPRHLPSHQLMAHAGVWRHGQRVTWRREVGVASFHLLWLINNRYDTGAWLSVCLQQHVGYFCTVLMTVGVMLSCRSTRQLDIGHLTFNWPDPTRPDLTHSYSQAYRPLCYLLITFASVTDCLKTRYMFKRTRRSLSNASLRTTSNYNKVHVTREQLR